MRKKIVSKTMSKVRAHLLGEVRQKVYEMAPLVRDIDAKLNYLQTMVHSQQLVIDELRNRTINSGQVNISDREVMTKIFSGAKMYLDPSDIGLVPHLILDGDWERNITRAWLSVVKPGNTIIDIGANFGYFSVLAAQQSNRNCRIIAFEANPKIIPYLSRTIDVNSFGACTTVENLAISDKKGELKLYILKDYIASSSVHSPQELSKHNAGRTMFEAESEVNVKSISIDEYCRIHSVGSVDLIKMDIEGYEDKAYKGMRGIVSKSPGATMFIEFTKEGYKKPKEFYKQMLDDFGNLFLVDENGGLYKPKNLSFEDVVEKVEGWVMLVFSKNKYLGLNKAMQPKRQ